MTPSNAVDCISNLEGEATGKRKKASALLE